MDSGLPRLFVIRHGETEWSATAKHTGLTDIPLNANGEKSALQLVEPLGHVRFDRVFTSPLIRARRTCELAGLGDRAEICPDLVEWDYGDFEGRKTVDIHKEWPEWDLFKDGGPHGESPEDVAARAGRFVRHVREIDGDVAAFSSGHTIRVIAAVWLGLPVYQARAFFTSTASIGILGYEHYRNQPIIWLWNDQGQMDTIMRLP